jgi:two-component system, LuxR family, sensor kinase FixL
MVEWSETFEANPDALGHALADAAADFVCLATAHGEPFYLNPAARRLLGLDESRPASAVNLRDCYAEQSWVELRDTAGPAVNRTGRWQGHSRLRNLRTGELIDVETTMLRVKSDEGGRPTCLAIVHRETDEQARLREALADAQAQKRAILESSLDPIITINHQAIITEFNKAAEQIFGHPREKILGTKPSDVLFPPAMSAGQQDRIDRYLDVGEGSLLGRRVEVTAVRANGDTFNAEMAMTISREEGAPVLTFFIRDISRRKKAEQEQARYAAELERSNRELEQFAYVASHDLQEPLRKIRTFGDRLQMLAADKLDEPSRDCIERMQNAAERMQSFIDGLLSLSRVTTQGQSFVAVDLEQVAREVVSDLEAQIERLDGCVEVGHLPTIQADPLQMRQLLQNLITNGLKFHRVAEPPVVRIEGKLVPGRQQRRPARSAAEQCQIVVEDNGIGFEEKHRDRIFGLFQRLHPRDVFEGTGIGLALCRKIVERHGGQISAQSAPDQGGTFEVLLPVTHSPQVTM